MRGVRLNSSGNRASNEGFFLFRSKKGRGMKTFLRLAVLALAGTGALALAGNALAMQKLGVRQTATSLTIKVSQAQTDPQPAKISIYVPSGYSINGSATAGTKIGTRSEERRVGKECRSRG